MAGTASEELFIRLLGPPRAILAGRDVPLGPPRQRALFTVLAIRCNQVVYLSELIDAVWGEALPGGPKGGVHTYVAGLRRVLEPGRTHRAPGRILESHGSGYRLNVSADHVDVTEFQRHRDQGGRAWRAGELESALKSFQAALDLFDGVVLGDVPGPFAATQRDRFTELRLTVLEDRIDVLLAQGRHAEAPADLLTLTRDHPLRERPWAQLMLTLYRQGRQADALAAFDRARAISVDELGLDPGPLLTDLRQRIVLGDPTLSGAPEPEPDPAPCTLPRDIEYFTGREHEVATLLATVDRAPLAGPPAPIVCAIDGMAGVGKTALAVHVAQRLADRYPDAQLYLDLHGHTPNVAPMTSAVALDKLLRALGVAGERIPAELDDRAALLRAQLAGRCALLVLDNVVDAAQVRPLLPGASGSLVLITARRRLPGMDASRFLALDVLPHRDAVVLFATVAGTQRAEAEPEVTEAVVRICGHLPLAVQIAAARLRHRPSWSVTHLLTRLGDEQRRLSELQAEDRSVAVAFALSCRSLCPAGQRLFRLLGLFPGPEFSVPAAAALADTDVDRVDPVLQEVVDAHLLDEPQPGRYCLHDLLAVFAARQCQDEEPAEERHAARERLFAFYLNTTNAAEDRLRPQRLDRAAGPAPGTLVQRFRDPAEALAWLDAERANLVPVVRAAAEHGFPAPAWQISRYLWGFFEMRGHWADWLTCYRLAWPCAREVGDRLAEARILVGLGAAHYFLRQHPEAIEHYLAALALMRETGFRSGEAGVLTNLGNTYRQLGQFAEAITCQERSVDICQRNDDHTGTAIALTNLGELYRDADRLPDSVTCLEQALAMFRGLEDRRLEASAQDSLARTYLAKRRHDEAFHHADAALAIRRATGDRYGEASTLDCLARIYRSTGRIADAERHWRQALALADELGAPLAEDIRAQLGELAGEPGPIPQPS